VSAAERRVRLPVARLDAGRRAGLTQGSSARWWRRCCRGPARRACCLQVHARTCCLDACTHAAGPLVLRAGPVSVAALLVAGARSVGLTPVVKPGVPALTRDRLLSAGSAASFGRHTGKARKTSPACSAWCSTPPCCGTPATSTPPSQRYVLRLPGRWPGPGIRPPLIPARFFLAPQTRSTRARCEMTWPVSFTRPWSPADVSMWTSRRRLRLVSGDFAGAASRGPQRTCWIRTFPAGVAALRSPG